MKIVTVILAGGKSSRMGEDKSLLEINGEVFLRNIYHIAQQCTEEVYVICPKPKKYISILPFCNFIPESQFFQGPLMAFHEALNYVQSDWVLLLACDLPFLTVIELKYWINSLCNLPENIMAFLPKNEKGWDCLCGFYRPSCRESLQKYLSQGNRSFQQWLNQEKVAEILVKNREILFNCNTPQDYELLKNITQK
ncbi:MAG: molybdenum cofactor guanylyltransferase [Cyanobacteria bacterium]|nr:molybdenum cofactor guanylyltransferase [Cyanobacteria bacterium CG_2015-16_32_12]NCO78852.1 molybdenum cofactor guanylyltransferase [Cyanobacteria bacterium CG_2015-22_32_23]NCQ05656.1 molybdenum cofactor guanylyltransferase [Cyanobacteria bacterium CG_2015-09_32_10]NCQ42580.1 molybdenum cofactor guanylyltransferase [Cyanobacteria bacterium CG_2015-04_32_10]NCS84717.1 molybdenum cofactor guanylyltransferase [Cyanobacteria bacterium CG_2015-02_32_10]